MKLVPCKLLFPVLLLLCDSFRFLERWLDWETIQAWRGAKSAWSVLYVRRIIHPEPMVPGGLVESQHGHNL